MKLLNKIFFIILVLLAGLTGCTKVNHLIRADVYFRIPENSEGKKSSTGISIKSYSSNYDGRQLTSSTDNIAKGVEFRKGRTYGPFPLAIIKHSSFGGSVEHLFSDTIVTIKPVGEEKLITDLLYDTYYSSGRRCHSEIKSKYFDQEDSEVKQENSYGDCK